MKIYFFVERMLLSFRSSYNHKNDTTLLPFINEILLNMNYSTSYIVI